jgi:hypothetical protein
MIRLANLPYWSPADQAELDLLVAEFVRVYWLHRGRCSTCVPGGWCDPLRDGFAAVTEWRDLRILQSRAAYARARQDFEAAVT